MFYLGCDQHARQVTVALRNDDGDIVLRRQVSTQPGKISAFLDDLRKESQSEGGYVAIVEVCGFNDWFIDLLNEKGCEDVILIQPTKKSSRKTDRRDAAQLSELLWINRDRLREEKRIHGLRRVHQPSVEDRYLRKLTTRMCAARRRRAQVVTRMRALLRNHNLQHECPVKTLTCNKGIAWLRELALPDIDRLELDHLLQQWDLLNNQIGELHALLENSCSAERRPFLGNLLSIPGCALLSALVILSRISDVRRFPNPRALSNYFGLTPKCSNSGETTKMGSITKEGSALVRFVLGLMVTHVVRKDPWMRQFYRRIKRRRGAKIARVAVMRRLCTIIYHMIKSNEPYICGGPEAIDVYRERKQRLEADPTASQAVIETRELQLQT